MTEYPGEERRKDPRERILFDQNKQCANHTELLEGVADHYKYKEEQIRRNEACDLQIAHNSKDIDEQKVLRSHCKAHALPAIRKDIETKHTTLCKIINDFKTEARAVMGKNRESFILKLSAVEKKINSVYAVMGLAALVISLVFTSVSSLSADVDNVTHRQNVIEVTDSRIQSDVEYLKQEIKGINTKLDEQTKLMQIILQRLPK